MPVDVDAHDLGVEAGLPVGDDLFHVAAPTDDRLVEVEGRVREPEAQFDDVGEDGVDLCVAHRSNYISYSDIVNSAE